MFDYKKQKEAVYILHIDETINGTGKCPIKISFVMSTIFGNKLYHIL